MKNVELWEVVNLIEKKVKIKLVNILPAESFYKLHIPTSVSVPFHPETFLKEMEKSFPQKLTTIILYSAGVECKLYPAAFDQLKRAGYKNVYVYKGGLKDWKNHHKNFEGQFSKKFNLAA